MTRTLNVWVKRLFIAIIFALSQASFAQQVQVQSSYDELSVAMKNTSYQFVYAFFGKDMLVAYVDNPQHESLIRAASDADLNHLAKPFNSSISNFLIAGLSLVYMLTVVYFFLKLALFVKENLWLIQREATGTVATHAVRGVVLRIIVFGGLALSPWVVFTQISEKSQYIGASNVLLMNALGMTHQLADESFRELIVKTRPSAQSIYMPRSDNKSGLAMALNSFFTCLRLDASRREFPSVLNVDFKRTKNGAMQGVLTEGQCSLMLSAAEDSGLIESAKNINRMSPKVAISPDLLASSQMSLLQNIFADAISRAYAASEILSLPTIPEEEVSESNKSTQFKTRPWTSFERSPSELERWQAGCDSLSSLSFTDGITERDRMIYNLLSARCSSRSISQKVLYPTSTPQMEKFLESGPLKNREMPLCMDASMTALNQLNYTPAYVLDSESSDIMRSREAISLEQCVVKLCSAGEISNGGLYLCSNAVSMLERRTLDVQAGERGIMAAGLYMFQMFTHQSPGDSAKRVYRTLNAEFSDTPFEGGSGDVVFTLPISIPPLREDHGNKFDDTLSSIAASESSEESVWLDPPLEDNGWLDAMTQHSRLMTCVKNPLQMTSGYVCGNIPQEFNRFGMNILRAAIAAKTILVVGDAVRRTGSTSIEQGTIGKNVVLSSVVSLTSWLGASLYADSVIDGVLSAGFSMTDDFGYWDQTQTRQWLSHSNVLTAALALGLSSHASAVQMIDSVLFLALMIGIVFAFLIPLFPLLLVLSALSKLLVLIVVNMSMTGFRLVNCAFEREQNEFLGGEFDELWSNWVATLLKMPLTIIGLGLAWLMSNVIIAHVLRRVNVSFVTNDGQNGILDTLVVLVVSMVIVYIVYNTVLTIIESFYDFTVEWVLGQMTNNPYGDRKGVGIRESQDVFRMMTGRI